MSAYFIKFLKSYTNALSGMLLLFKSQPNARIELVVATIVTIGGFIFKISSVEWSIILLCIAMVLGLEGINTAIEILANKVHPGFDHEIGKVKDVAAGAVLIASLLAAIIGFIIFVPYLLNFLLN